MKLMTADDVAELLQVPKTWVYRAARDGSLPSVSCGRYRRFHEDDVTGYIDKQRTSSMGTDNKAAPATLTRPGARPKEM